MGTTGLFESVSFTDINNGTIAGSKIFRTTDGGTTWNQQGPAILIFSVKFIDANNGMAVGSNGTILRTTNGGITFIGNDNNKTIPKEFVLAQNYPNPFNPTTTINYSIPKAGQVKLTIYNTIGSKVATVVNEYKPAGNYSVKFIVSNLASGIYLYKLESGNYSAAKKFILLK
jgi:hypothetical protein